MKKQKGFKYYDFLLVLFSALLLTSVIFLFSGLVLVYDHEFYKEGFRKNEVYTNFGNETYVNDVSLNLINYFSGEESLMKIYSEEEIVHLKDVRNVVNNLNVVFYILVILLLALFFVLWYSKYKYYWLVFVFGFGLIILVSLLFYVSALVNFGSLFDLFHRLLFSNEFWMLGEDTVLVRLFPAGFFIDALGRILLYSFFLGLLSLSVGFYLKQNHLNYK